MDKKKLEALKVEIINCKKKLKELEPQISENTGLERVYNKTLIKKAVLMQKYNKICHKPSIKEKIKRLLRIHTKKKLICDYFKTSEA